jgi:hypothetical protein
MTDFETSLRIWRQKLAVQGILWKCRNVLPFASDKRFEGIDAGTCVPDNLMDDFDRYLKHLASRPRTGIRRLLVSRITSLVSGTKPTRTLEQRLRELSDSCDQSLAAIPPSVGKARGSLAALVDIGDLETDQELDAMCLLKDHITPKDVERIVADWKRELRCHLELGSRPIPVVTIGDEASSESESGKEQKYFYPLPPSHIFWTSREFVDTSDALSRYRFMEAFGIGEFPETMADIEGMFASALMTSDPDM